MDSIEALTEGGRESGDMDNLIILLSMIHLDDLGDYLDLTLFSILDSTSSKRAKMSSMLSGGVTPEIRQHFSGGSIVFNAIHACWKGIEKLNQQPGWLSLAAA